jgi:hypothetical protein
MAGRLPVAEDGRYGMPRNENGKLLKRVLRERFA